MKCHHNGRSGRPIANLKVPQPRAFAGINLTDAEVEKFKAIYQRNTGRNIDLARARELATKLMTFVHALVRPDKQVNKETPA